MDQGPSRVAAPDAPRPDAPTPRVRERRLDLDRARGIAILLVVFGHLSAQDVPAGITWYEPVRYAIYRFHMPFFLYLSGTVAVLSGLLATAPPTWPAALRKRAVRLLVPFFGIGLLILAAKLTAQQFVYVDNPPEGLAGGLRDLFWTTDRSPASSVWYLLVLFVSTIVALLLRRLGGTGLVVLGLALQCIDVPPVAYLDRFASHFLFFAAGVWFAERQDRALPAFERLQLLWWVAFAAGLAAAALGWLDARWSMVVCGLLCIPALHGAIRRPPVSGWHWPLTLGRFAMAIYLFNTLAIGGGKAILIAGGIGWTEDFFLLHLAIGMVLGVAVPVLLKLLVLRRIPVLDRLTD